MHVSMIIVVVPSGAPSNISLIESTSTSLSFTWQEPSSELQNGNITSYLGFIFETAGPNVTTEVIIDSTNQVVVTGLIPHISYVFQLAAVNDVGIGPYSATFLARTAEDGKGR